MKPTILACCLAALLLLPSVSCKERAVLHPLEPGPSPPPALETGIWGGDHAGMTVTETGATLEFDCAHGTIDGPIPLDDSGAFAVDGLYYQEHGGPFIDPDPLVPVKVTYMGQVSGTRTTLIIFDPDAQVKYGGFLLTYGATPHLVKCL